MKWAWDRTLITGARLSRAMGLVMRVVLPAPKLKMDLSATTTTMSKLPSRSPEFSRVNFSVTSLGAGSKVRWSTVVSRWAWSTETLTDLMPEPASLAVTLNSRLLPVAGRSGETTTSGGAMSLVK